MYESIELSRLVELAPLTTTTELEKVVVETASSNNIQVDSCGMNWNKFFLGKGLLVTKVVLTTFYYLL